MDQTSIRELQTVFKTAADRYGKYANTADDATKSGLNLRKAICESIAEAFELGTLEERDFDARLDRLTRQKTKD